MSSIQYPAAYCGFPSLQHLSQLWATRAASSSVACQDLVVLLHIGSLHRKYHLLAACLTMLHVQPQLEAQKLCLCRAEIGEASALWGFSLG